MLRPLITVLAALTLFWGVPYLRALSESYHHLELARNEKDGGNLDLAIQHYRRAGAFYAPGNIWAITALEEFYEVAKSQPDNAVKSGSLLGAPTSTSPGAFPSDSEIKTDALREFRTAYIASDFGHNLFDSRSLELFREAERELGLKHAFNLNERPARGLLGFISCILFMGWIGFILILLFRDNKARTSKEERLPRRLSYFSSVSNFSLGTLAAVSFILWLTVLRFA